MTVTNKIVGLYSSFPESSHEKAVAQFFEQLENPRHRQKPATPRSNPLFLCFTNRCGSTWIGALLAEVGVFPSRTDGKKNFEFFNADSVTSIAKSADLHSMREYISHLNQEYVGAAGFFSTKISVDQLAWITRAELIRDLMPKPRFLFVRRRNTLAQAISFSIALQTHQWTSNHNKEAAEPEFRPQHIMDLHRIILNANAHFEAYFQLHQVDPLVIYYEDVIGKDKKFLDLAEAYLGVSLENPVEREEEFTVRKQSTSRNSEWEEKMRQQYANKLGPLPPNTVRHFG
ncbi:Stf0 family sulfotransferase [Salipiger bermudensis]|uniref:Stf0 family sulfotransferase n=1 Tax=Salipiger bermudensis TaxID=344736 RepID=UPI0030084D90